MKKLILVNGTMGAVSYTHLDVYKRQPYDWFPQAAKPEERPVTPVKNSRLRLREDGTPYLIEDDPFFVEPGESIF